MFVVTVPYFVKRENIQRYRSIDPLLNTFSFTKLCYDNKRL